MSKGIDYTLLPGKWKLVYTTAPDVKPLLAADNALIPLRVPAIYQEFSSAEQGDVKNIIVFSAPPFIHEGKAIALCRPLLSLTCFTHVGHLLATHAGMITLS